jgi:transcriptional antiterminator NusG
MLALIDRASLLILGVEKHWFVFYTKSRQEKKVKELLVRDGFEVFLPMQKIVRQWSDRKKKIDVPLFNSYIFVKGHEHTIQNVLKTPGIAWTIRHNGKPAVLRKDEYVLISRFLESGFFIEATTSIPEFQRGDRTRIMDGPLKGIEGYIERQSDTDSFYVILEGIDHVLKTSIPAFLLKKL